ncbi:hypothetical protein BJX96DRAFT_151768 [Aspergillus floccosus]
MTCGKRMLRIPLTRRNSGVYITGIEWLSFIRLHCCALRLLYLTFFLYFYFYFRLSRCLLSGPESWVASMTMSGMAAAALAVVCYGGRWTGGSFAR